MADGVNKSTLSKTALRTGGQFFSQRKNEDLTDAFERIANELRNQYLLSCVPLNRNAEPSYRACALRSATQKSQRHCPRLFYRPGYYFRQQTANHEHSPSPCAHHLHRCAERESNSIQSIKVKSALCTSANWVETICKQIEGTRTPSQVYFPKRLASKQGEDPDPELPDEDIEAVQKIFSVLSAVVGDSNDELQIIVLDHAAENVWGGLKNVHLVEEWRGGRKLVPLEWLPSGNDVE